MSEDSSAISITEDQTSLLSDLSDDVSDLKSYLRPGEKVIQIEHCPTPPFKKLVDYHKELCRLSRVSRPEDIGKNGPAMAARTAKQAPGQGLFECRFGRDGLVAAENLLPEFPQLTRVTLLDYAGLIGMIDDLYREEEFGRMFHEARHSDDPIARSLTKRKGWDWPFYATVDATPLFVRALYNYIINSSEGISFLDQTYVGRDGNTHTMRNALRYSMMWIVNRINQNSEHFLEYKPAFPGSHVNQIMEDSGDSHFHANGALANFNRSNSSTEVQGLVYDALLMAAELKELEYDLRPKAMYYRYLASEVRRSVCNHLIVNDERGTYFAVGSDRGNDGRVRVMKVRKAIPFFLLNSRMFDSGSNENKQIVESCIKTIFSPEFLCAGGIRTLAHGEPRFMPTAYHNGTSWPMQTFEIAEGLRRHGFHALAAELDRRIVRVCEETKLYPEHVRGDIDDVIRLNERRIVTWDPLDQRKNRREAPPQQIQLWTLTAYAAIRYRKHQGQKTVAPTRFEEEILNGL